MISRYDLSLANAIAHNDLAPYLQVIFIGCERCGNPHLLWVDHKIEKPRNEHEDLILVSWFFLKCPECGFEEANQITTIIPSWQWHPYRERMPKSGIALFKEKVDIVKLWKSTVRRKVE